MSLASKMPNRFGVLLMVLVSALAFSPVALGRSKRPQQAPAVKDQKSAAVKGQRAAAAPAPRHDVSGTWEPANGPSDGIQGTGSKSMPADGKHEPPYTPLGLELLNRSKPGNGNREVLPA